MRSAGGHRPRPAIGVFGEAMVRMFLVAFLLLATVAVGAAARAETRGLTVKMRASEAADAPPAGEVALYRSSHALVIGIDEYTGGWPRLSNAVEDARLVAAELERRGFDVTLKTNLTSSALKSAFEEFFIIKGEDPAARLFVWYAGHGHSAEGEGFLVPADAPRPAAGARFKLSALAVRRFGEYVRLAQSKHAFAVFDACFAGTVFDSQRTLPPAAITHATTMPVRQFLTSGDATQTVSDDGAFRELFIRALRGEERADANRDGYVTASEIGLFLADRVTNLTGARQTPRYGKLRDKDYDFGDFVFAASPLLARRGASVAPPAPGDRVDTGTQFWQSIEKSAEIEAYLSRFANGTFAEILRNRLEALKDRQAPTPPRRPPPASTGPMDSNSIPVSMIVARGIRAETLAEVPINAKVCGLTKRVMDHYRKQGVAAPSIVLVPADDLPAAFRRQVCDVLVQRKDGLKRAATDLEAAGVTGYRTVPIDL